MINTISNYQQLSEDYYLIEKALNFLEDNYLNHPTLEEIASSVGLSEFHFQRLFTHWVGISPKRFLQFLTKEHAKTLLDHSTSLLEASYQSGLSGPGRLHDLFVSCEAVTPGEYKSRGEGVKIAYGYHFTPFGECLLAITERGVCGLSFVNGDRYKALEQLRLRWLRAKIYEDKDRVAELITSIFPIPGSIGSVPLHLMLNGTNFQIKVWEALLRIPSGNLVSYEEIARYIGSPNSVRAVSNAVAHNPIAVIIPCHRVIRKMGVLGGYQWGTARKKAILGWEMARANQ